MLLGRYANAGIAHGESHGHPLTIDGLARHAHDHLFDVAATRHDLSQPRERSAAAAELTPIIALTADRVIQSHYMQRLARMVQVDEATLRLELRQPVHARAERAAEAAASASNKAVHDRREEFCLALLFRYPELRVLGEELDAGLFTHSENRALFEAWIAHAEATDALEHSLNSDLRPQYERISTADVPTYDDENLAKALRSAVWRIEQDRLRLAKRASALENFDRGDANFIAACVAPVNSGVWGGRTR